MPEVSCGSPNMFPLLPGQMTFPLLICSQMWHCAWVKKATYYMVLLIEHSQDDNTTEENRSVVARGSGWCVWSVGWPLNCCDAPGRVWERRQETHLLFPANICRVLSRLPALPGTLKWCTWLWLQLFIHSLTKHLMSAYCMPVAVLGAASKL